MKNNLSFILILCLSLVYAQNVVLNKVEKMHHNTDKIFYKIDDNQIGAEYLGELEVQGFSNDDTAVFGKVYKKAKEIGANAFTYLPFQNIDGTIRPFDSWNYRLKLYYLPSTQMPQRVDELILIGSPLKEVSFRINKENLRLQERTYMQRSLRLGEIITVSTKKLLGSSVRLSGNGSQPVQYFQISGFKVDENNSASGGLNFKSGDIIGLERSYADFLTVIYTKQQ